MLPAVAGTHQQAAELPRLTIESRDDVLTALSVPHGDRELWAVLLAAEGRRISPWLRDILRDDAVHFAPKVQALAVLRYTRDSLLVDDRLQLMATGPEILQVRAREALVFFPYPAVCAAWRRLIADRHAADNALHSAIAGLGYCGSEADTALLNIVRQTARYQSVRDLAVSAINRVRLPVRDRFPVDIWAGRTA
jgi:hypothetical protein